MNDAQIKEYEKYLNKGFSTDQLDEIRYGIEQGYDVSAYARPSISAADMNHIRKSMNYRRKMETLGKEKAEKEEKQKKKEKPVPSSFRKKKEGILMLVDGSLWIAGVSIVMAAVVIVIVLAK